MSEIRQYERYAATIRIRRGEGWSVKPEMEPYDGRRVTVRALWRFVDERTEYAGEWAMQPDVDVPCGWIASGDLVDVEPLHAE